MGERVKGRGRKRVDGVSEMMDIRGTEGQVIKGKCDKKGDRGVARNLRGQLFKRSLARV